MKIVIVGAGEVGRHLAELLSTREHDICIIEASESLAAELNDQLDVHTIHGNGAFITALAEADVAEADLFLALTSQDTTNLVAGSVAQAVGAKKTIARVHGGIQREEWLFDYRSHFGIDYLFSTERLAAVELAKFVRNPEGLLIEEFARGRVELQQAHVAHDSRLIRVPLRELKLPSRARVALIQRQGETLVPGGDETLEPGDLVTVFGDPDKVTEVLDLLRAVPPRNEALKIVIFGGGEYGFALAQMLEGTYSTVRILEKDEKRCRELSNTLLKTVVIHGDATSLSQLKEEQLGEADFFIATTEDDEDNVMACLQAKNLGAKYCVTLIHRADYAAVITQNSEQLGILGAISPRVTAARDLLRFLTGDRFHVVLKLVGGAEVLEFPITRASPVNRQRVAELAWPNGSGLVALQQGQQVQVPSGDDVIQEGDTLYVIVAPDAKKELVRQLTGR